MRPECKVEDFEKKKKKKIKKTSKKGNKVEMN